MKKHGPLVATLFLACASLSMTDHFYSSLLNGDDYRMQELDGEPALSAPLDGKTPFWASFNQWLCFPTEAVTVACLEAEYGGVVKVPALQVVRDAHFYEISMDPDPKPDCEHVTRRWRELLEGENRFCVYAALLQEHDGVPLDSGAKEGSVWIINRIKSGKGYWNFDADENWMNDDQESETAMQPETSQSTAVEL